MKTGRWTVMTAMVAGLLWAGGARAGDLSPASSPGPTMHTLEELYQQLLTTQSQVLSNQQAMANLGADVTNAQASQDAMAAMLANLASSQGSTVSNLWQTSGVDSTGSVGQHNSLAFTPSGHPAISYRNVASNDLKYAEFDGSAWNVQTVDSASDVRDFTSLAFTTAGRPAIAYFDQTAYDLKYAEYNGSTWSIQTVDSVDIVGQYASLAFTPDDRPAISYYDAGNADLKYAEWSGSAWIKTTVDGASSTVGFYTSLAFTPAGRPAISYFGGNPNNDLKYAEYNGSSWTITTVDTEGNTGYYTSLAFTPAGRPAISYYDNSNTRLLYTEYNDSAWVRSVVQTGTVVGYCTSLAFTSGGQPAIAYTDFANRNVLYAEYDGTQWVLSLLDSVGDVGLYLSLAFSPDGQPAVSYFDDTNDDLKYVTVVGSTVSPQPGTVQSRLAAISNQVSATQVQVTTVGSQVTTVGSQVTSVNNQVTGLQSQLAGVSNQAVATHGQITTVGSQVTSVSSQVSGLQGQLAGVSNQILTVKGLILAVDSKMVTLTNQIYLIEQRLQAAGLVQTVDDMVLIPAGSYMMGDPLDGNTNDAPMHAVQVSAFYMDKYEVTKAKWDEVRAWAITNGYTDLVEGGGKALNHPVQTVDWYACLKWCNARSAMEGLTPCYNNTNGTVYMNGDWNGSCNWSAGGYRLPTEAEWEKAARGGVINHRFPWSDANTIQHTRANYSSSTNYSYDTSSTLGTHPDFTYGEQPFTSPVGSFSPNGYGLYDMAGNVWEWCWDYYSETYYSSSPGTDPRGPNGYYKVMRGGSWLRDADKACCGKRSDFHYYGPDGNNHVGFRCARGL